MQSSAGITLYSGRIGKSMQHARLRAFDQPTTGKDQFLASGNRRGSYLAARFAKQMIIGR